MNSSSKQTVNGLPSLENVPPSALSWRDLFPPHEVSQWKAAAVASLKDVPFEKALVTKTIEGIDLPPLVTRADLAGLDYLGQLPGQGGRLRGSTAAGYRAQPWLVSQELSVSDAGAFNRAARKDWERGQTELNILLNAAARSAGMASDRATANGLALTTLDDLEGALAGFDLAQTPIFLRAGSSGLPVAGLFLALAKRRGTEPAALRGCVEMDPLGGLVTQGTLPLSLEAAWGEMAALARYAANHAPGLQTILVQGHLYHDGGAHAVQELAFAVATGAQYVREMISRGLTPAEIAPRLRFSFGIGSHFFMEIAKLRAFRLLWSAVMEAFGGGVAECRAHCHARTSLWNKSRLDPHTNLLRATSEAFAAVAGGCDSLQVGAFDETIRTPDDFSRRLARNIQIILAEECSMTQVNDPAGGSYYVEWLTAQVAARSWALFQKIEADGGMTRALHNDWPQTETAQTAEVRLGNLARRRDLLVGVNAYPNARERPLASSVVEAGALCGAPSGPVARDAAAPATAALEALRGATADRWVELAVEAAGNGASLAAMAGAMRHGQSATTGVTPLAQRRLAQPFERLREAVLALVANGQPVPRLLQVNFGPSRHYRLRADWTSAFFQLGGFEVLADRDFKTADEAAQALAASDARLAVITATDETYAQAVPALATALKAARPDLFLLVAGAPGASEKAWREAGVDDFVHVRVNPLEMNEKLLQRLGVLPTRA